MDLQSLQTKKKIIKRRSAVYEMQTLNVHRKTCCVRKGGPLECPLSYHPQNHQSLQGAKRAQTVQRASSFCSYFKVSQEIGNHTKAAFPGVYRPVGSSPASNGLSFWKLSSSPQHNWLFCFKAEIIIRKIGRRKCRKWL